MKLTNESIATIVASKGDEIFWDDAMAGFGVRLRNGRKSYVVQYRVGRQQRRESLGDIRKVKLPDARKAAQQRFAQVELGVDPGAERQKARVADAAVTLGAAAKLYLSAKEGSVRASTYRDIQTYLTGAYWKPLAEMPLADVSLQDVAARLRWIIEQHGKSSAHAARAKLHALYSWGQGEGLCSSNPVAYTNNPREGSRPRSRILSDLELRRIWHACPIEDDSSGSDFNRIVRLLILLGSRRDEIGGLQWGEIAEGYGVVSIPGARTKNHQPLTLQLPPSAIAILPRRDGRGFVFGQSGKGFSGWSYQMKALLVRIAAANGPPLPHFTLHDFRRTFRTGLGKLGIPPHVAEAAIGHSKPVIQATYDLCGYEDEVGAALRRWADHVSAVVGENVVPLVA